ncbi:MAG TPA: alanine racemase [Candidatus Lustribacter sp.]|nr:alanine racemase [Candidatus Lustribacter sp.]
MSALPSCARVDLDAITANVRILREHAPTASVMAVVKADGYGHGLLPSARAALSGGASWLGVAQLGEALALRAAGITAPTLTWLHVPGAAFTEAVEAGIDLGVSADWAVAEIVAAARETGRTARIHLKVDTGLSRGGVMPADLPAALDGIGRAVAEESVELVGVWSHFAWADDPDHPTVRRQHEVFVETVRTIEAAGLRPQIRHLANSAATLTNPAAHFDLVRPGLAVYGLSPVPQLGGPEHFGLVPAMTLIARLSSVKRVPRGSGVSYGHQYVTERDTVLGLVPMGYADGIPRNATNVGPLAVAGARHTIAGRVCMDQVVVDLGPDSAAAAGDEVLLFGPAGPAGSAGSAGPSAQDWADATGTISYEIVTRIGARVPRRYAGALASETAAAGKGEAQ